MSVHNILEARPHISGKAKCLACQYEWIAVAACGDPCLECPECGTFRGVYVGAVIPETRFVCDCGCMHFAIEPGSKAMCCNCGATYEF